MLASPAGIARARAASRRRPQGHPKRGWGGAAGTDAAKVGLDKLANVGVLYQGLTFLGDGAILTGLVLGAMAVFIIERQFLRAGAFAGAGAVLSYFGFMHGPAVGFGVTPQVALAYALVGLFLAGCAQFEKAAAPVIAPVEPVAAE